MDRGRLLSKIDSFCKNAGLINPPAKLLNDVQNWAVSCFANESLKYIDIYLEFSEHLQDQENAAANIQREQKEFNFLRGLLTRLSRGASKRRQFVFSTADIPYLASITPAQSLRFAAKFETSGNSETLGTWLSAGGKHIGTHQLIGILSIRDNVFDVFGRVPKDYKAFSANAFTRKFRAGIEEIKTTVEHELIHFLQTALQRHKKLKEPGGLPPAKVRDPLFDPHGNPIRLDPEEEEIAEQYGSIDLSQTHALLDIEFYANLKDEVNRFKSEMSLHPVRLHKWLARVWVNDLPANKVDEFYSIPNFKPSNFFIALQDELHPERYMKAVKEFYKAVGV